MPRWKKDAKEFEVSVNRNAERGYQTTIPKPVADLLHITEDVKAKFVIKGKKVELEAGGKKE